MGPGFHYPGTAVVGNYLLNDVVAAVRALGVVVVIAAAGAVALQTTKGKATLAFARESRLEVRKVVWPTRQEAIQTTLIVLAVTAVMGLLLFILDGALVWLVNLITGV